MPRNYHYRRAEDRLTRKEIWQNVCGVIAVLICVGAGITIKLTGSNTDFVNGLFALFMFAAVAFAVPTNFRRFIDTIGPYVPIRRQSLARRAIDEADKSVKASKKAAHAARDLVDSDGN